MSAGAHEERRTVSRKTPNDGKLEISADAARSFREERIALTLDDATAAATVVSLPCTCRPTPHVHHFLEAELLRALTP